jgi:serine/threonine-protein kinase
VPLTHAPLGPGAADANPTVVNVPDASLGSDAGVLAGPPTIPDYEILSELGRGGMGLVYKARQVKLNRVVALKMIRAGAHAGSHELARFKAEAEAVAALPHPGIVQVYDAGEHQGVLYFAMEFCPGGSLASRLDGRPLPVREAAQVVAQITQAIQFAHERGVLHRDIKPANVLVGADGSPKISDFGLARRMAADPGLTGEGAILGTPAFMAPEQARGEQVGETADIYSLGSMLYECLTGKPPFQASSPIDTIVKILNDAPVPPRQLNPEVPRDLEGICLRCLEKDPARRYPSAGQLAGELERFLAAEPQEARRRPRWWWPFGRR